MCLLFPSGIDSKEFLRSYWQQRPLLMKGALPHFRNPVSPERLAGLACEEHVESRIVTGNREENNWQGRPGPFDEQDFTQLPASHWSLLVQDVDKHLTEVSQLLDAFRFIPDWRLDDIMISYAVDQGSVGPHIDDYDVFLVQAEGRRRWHIDSHSYTEEDFIPGLDLRILPEFNPEMSWLMEPGDVLYLPPNLAHWGIAEGECITCSVGFRAPNLRELTSAWCDELIERHVPRGRYRDREPHPQQAYSEITPDVMQRIGDMMQQFLQLDEHTLQRWFGSFITEQKSHLQEEICNTALGPEHFLNEFQQRATLYRNNYSRMAFFQQDESALLFANGECYELPPGHRDFLQIATQARELHYGGLHEWLKEEECLDLLCTLYNCDCFYFADGQEHEDFSSQEKLC